MATAKKQPTVQAVPDPEQKVVAAEVRKTENLTDAEKAARAVIITKARTDAVSALTEKYRDELNAEIKAYVRAAGYEWAPRPTEEEKARAQAEALLEQFPALREQLLGGSGG